MNSNNQTIFIVDDDPEICNALRYLFESVDFKVETYMSAQLFIDKYSHNKSGFIIVDVRMPVMSGLELLEYLNLNKNRLPVIIITGYGDIAMAIRAMKAGALDFVLKPFNDQCLLEIVQKYASKKVDYNKNKDINDRILLLSERERQLLKMISEGKLNKEIAYESSISISTVEAHRASIMRKMQAKNMAQLIKLYLQSELYMEFQ